MDSLKEGVVGTLFVVVVFFASHTVGGKEQVDLKHQSSSSISHISD